jgi:integrase
MKKSSRTISHFDDEVVIRGSTYAYRGTPYGTKKQIEKSLKLRVGMPQKAVIEAKKKLLESLERRGSAPGPGTFAFVADTYIEYREREAKDPEMLANRTFKETKGILNNHFKPYCGPILRIEDFDQNYFEGYCGVKSKQGLNLTNHRKVISHMMKWATHRKYLKYRPELEIPKWARKPRRKREILTDDETKRLFEKADGKILLYIGMYLLMGMRNMEICALRWDEMDFEKKSLWVNPKNNRRRKSRTIPINPWILRNLKRLGAGTTSEYIFPSARRTAKCPHMHPAGSIRKPWLKLLSAAGIDRHLTPHDMRATFEKFMHINPDFTDTQREKMAGAKIDVQKDIYVTMNADDLRGLERSVKIKGLDKVLKNKSVPQKSQIGQTSRAKSGVKR